MRAREPDLAGHITRDGVEVAYEVFGAGERTVVFLPTSPIVQSRVWKGQVAFLARHARVITIDPRGNGRSGRPADADAYRDVEYVADTMAVLDELSDAVSGARGRLLVELARRRHRRTPPAPRGRARRDSTVAALRGSGAGGPGAVQLRRRPAGSPGLGKGQPPPHRPGLARLRPVLLRRAAPRAALDEALRGRARVGAGHDRGDLHRLRGCAALRRRRELPATRSWPGSGAPRSSSTAPTIGASRSTVPNCWSAALDVRPDRRRRRRAPADGS